MNADESLFQKAQQYLRSAAVLLEMGDFDSCASRAYFAMFHAAQAALLVDGYDLSSGRSGIRTAFAERYVRAGRFPERAVDALDRAYALQQRADYAFHRTIEQGHAERALQEAEAFVNSVARALRRSASASS